MHFSFGMLGQLLRSTALANRNRQTFAKGGGGGIYVSVRHVSIQQSIQPSLLYSPPLHHRQLGLC